MPLKQRESVFHEGYNPTVKEIKLYLLYSHPPRIPAVPSMEQLRSLLFHPPNL